MRAAIYNPYWDTLGGGERYTISFAKALSELGYQVDVEWKNKNILESISARFGIKSDAIRIVSDIKRGDGYDLCFWVSDGSIPLLHSRKNILHFQVPFRNVNGRSLLNRMKLFRIKKIVCNSNFTKNVIDKEFGVESAVVYPLCGTDRIRPKRKENIIINVGRFSQLLQSKRQDVLVDAFIKLVKKGFQDWRLIIAGGREVGGDVLINKLRDRSKGYPIEILENPPYKELITLYGRSRIFWSASGFGESEMKNPEKVEHFGITVVEAMAGGCVPVVYCAGGHKEIISDRVNGFLWKDRSEIVKITQRLITDKKHLRSVSKDAVFRSNNFGYENFTLQVEKILQ